MSDSKWFVRESSLAIGALIRATRTIAAVPGDLEMSSSCSDLGPLTEEASVETANARARDRVDRRPTGQSDPGASR